MNVDETNQAEGRDRSSSETLSHFADAPNAARAIGFRPFAYRSADPLTAVETRIGLLGDTHGNFPWTRDALQRFLTIGIRQIHVLGDFGFIWHGGPREHKLLGRLDTILAAGDARLYVTGGNHEGYAALQRQFTVDEHGYRHLTEQITFLPRGWRGRTQAGTIVASLGGANSIDRWRRRPPREDGHGGSWWPEESITEADLNSLGTDRAHVLLGHEAPWSRALEQHINWRRSGLKHWELAYAAESQQMFQRAVEQVQPRLTVSGHHHVWIDTVESHESVSGEEFKTRSVVLNRDGTNEALAVLDVDRCRLNLLPRDVL